MLPTSSIVPFDFEPDPATSIEQTNAVSPSSSRKWMKDGQLLIERDGKLYNALGTEVK